MELGGGTVIDMGIYCVQLACFIFKERPEKVVNYLFSLELCFAA